MLLKSKNPFLPGQKPKEINEDISVVKLNFSNLNKAVIMRLKSMETLKKHSFIIITSLKQVSA